MPATLRSDVTALRRPGILHLVHQIPAAPMTNKNRGAASSLLGTAAHLFDCRGLRAVMLMPALSFAGLAACGGSGDSAEPLASPPPAAVAVAPPAPSSCIPPPEGLPPPGRSTVMGGTIVGRHDSSFIFVAESDGEKSLLFYGPDLASTSNVTGFVYVGGAWCRGSDWITYNGLDRGRKSQDPVYLNTTRTVSPPTLSGTIRYPSGAYTVVGGAVPGSIYDAAASPGIADAVGKWTMSNDHGTLVEVTVDVNGDVTGSDRGCSFAGALAPSPDGLNLLSLQLTFPSKCSMRPTLMGKHEGFALAMPLDGGGTQFLIWAETNDGFDLSYVMAIGRR